MTSELDVIKTNELLRRRKLRLQQVREQSKDIAKKIRQRAKTEKLRNIVDFDSKKQKEYLECQEKLVKRLELIYSKRLENVGAGHKKALEISQTDIIEKTDLSKLRGKEAVAELRKRKQEQLDKQKQLLERKVQAREIANEISREKSSLLNKNLTKYINNTDTNSIKATSSSNEVNDKDKNDNKGLEKHDNDVTKADMGTQWESEEIPLEWEPNIPSLSLPKDDTAVIINENVEKSDKIRKPNLFALSDEMPSSLRGGLSSVPAESAPFKPALTLVSEYLKNRNLQLRQFESVKKPTDDLQSIKQTIIRTRMSRANGSVFDSICHVLDEQLIPVPSWQPEENLNFSTHHTQPFSYQLSKFDKNNNLNDPPFSNENNLNLYQMSNNFTRIKNTSVGIEPVSGKKDKSFKLIDPEFTLTRKKSISVYNHNSRDVINIPYGDEQFVAHDNKGNEDAYAQALQETISATHIAKEKVNKKQQDLRNKVAVTKQNVDKEYRDTLTFLNSISKDKDINQVKPFLDEQRQQLHKDRRQRKMQQEFKKIEKESHKQNCRHNRRRSTVLDKNEKQSKSPVNIDEEQRRDFEYSWMPVPESDDDFKIHTIPTSTKNKSGNTVKFSETNGYLEYRSRHKHTPPTKDINDERHGKKFIETVIYQENSNDDSENLCVSETSSVENLSLVNDKKKSHLDSKLRDADRIIIYKILESKNRNIKNSRKSQSVSNSEKSSSCNKKHSDNQNPVNFKSKTDGILHTDSCNFEELQEGVYKGVNKEGLAYNFRSCYSTNIEMWQSSTEFQSWWANIASIDFSDDHKGVEIENHKKDAGKYHKPCCSGKDSLKTNSKEIQREGGDNISRPVNADVGCHCSKSNEENSSVIQASEATSAASFKTAPNDKAGYINPEAGMIKLIDHEQESGKFYIGASGFIKEDNYEVIIQLRKKEAEKSNIKKKFDEPLRENPCENNVLTLGNKLNTVVGKDLDHLLNNTKDNPIAACPSSNADTTAVATSDDASLKNKVQSSNKENGNDVIESLQKTQSNNMCEKAVHTSFDDCYAIPEHVPKTDTLPRPATSTYTQTSFNSSIQRPVFMHMSSSTSTAYMSPPELVLPDYLKNDYIMKHEELFESENSINETDSRYQVFEECGKKNKKYMCKKCTAPQKLNLKYKNNIATITPPNTAQSSHDCNVPHRVKETKTKKCKCHKCLCKSETKIRARNYRRRSKSVNTNSTREDLPENKNKEVHSSKNQKSTAVIKDQGDINPIVKKYVNKLLALNKEGLRAVEIMNQDCSVASTPSSSIINVPNNNTKQHLTTESIEKKISLEQIKNILKQQILKDYSDQNKKDIKCTNVKSTESQTEKNPILVLKFPKKKSMHKVKTLNISRQLLRKKKVLASRNFCNSNIITSTSSSAKGDKKTACTHTKYSRLRSKSSPTPRFRNSQYKNSTSSDMADPKNIKKFQTVVKDFNTILGNKDLPTGLNTTTTNSHRYKHLNLQGHREKTTYNSSDSEVPSLLLKHLTTSKSPTNISTQTNGSIDAESNYMKLAEDKLQNMEKIADLTEKCTKRLSNLAKVLEEVRKNKSLAYSQISTSESASESENKSDKNETTETPLLTCPETISQNRETPQPFSSLAIPANLDARKLNVRDSTDYFPFLIDIPKPVSFVTLSNDENHFINDKTNQTKNTIELESVKVRGRPPPALSRINLKNGQEISVTPHELSTVIEVDSPMSVKLKNQSSRYDTKFEMPDKNQTSVEIDNKTESISNVPTAIIDPDLLQSNVTNIKTPSKILFTESSDDSKRQTIELKQFNNIILKPFVTLQEYAKQCNIGIEEGSKAENIMKDDDLSSLHSDGSLPDVIAELLRRNIISEPFKFESASNGNSTSMSSESTLSVLALSKSRKDKKKSGILIKNKENIADSSETLSISSNPDLENAFQKLGMGWASSTLKKTKERLALSSSSNTSSSSMAQFKIKTFSQIIPNLATDSASSLLDFSNNNERKTLKPAGVKDGDNFKNAVQQTSLTNSMTVKEFLTNELAKKITFSNKSTKNDTDEQFLSLYETNMPDDMKKTNIGIKDDDQSTVESNNVRARTSTPVQIFKSTTYHSTSSSNTSNGLFSNADDLSSVKVTSNSMRNHSTSDKDDLTIPNYSLKTRKEFSDFSKSD